MKIEKETSSYNERRFGKPWIAKIVFVGREATFNFGSWVGQTGEEGLLVIDLEPGDVYAMGQRDTRKMRNSAPDFYVFGGDPSKNDAMISKADAYKHFTATMERRAAAAETEKQAETEKPAQIDLSAISTEDLLAELRRRNVVPMQKKTTPKSAPTTHRGRVMARAWEIAREAASKHGGSSRQYFSDAMKQAWAELGKTVKAA